MTTEPIHILIVDDTPQNLVTLEAVLDDPGIVLVPARSGREALRCLLKQDFAAILLDVNMPDMDGFEAATMIRQRPTSARTPIIFLTAYPGEAQLTRAYSLGAVDYMLTPVEPDVLRAKVAVFADLYRKTAEIARQAERLREAEEQLRRQAEEKLRESEGRFQVLCTSAPLAIFQTDVDGRCVYVSRPWEATTGQPPAEASGYGWLDAISPGRGEQVLESWREAVASGRVWSYEDRVTPADAVPRWLHVMASPIAGASGAPIGHVGTVEDITPRKQVEEQLRDADRRKDEFLAMLAHELRNPLAAIGSAVVIARTPGLESRRDWGMQVISRQVQHLSKLIDDLLDVSRITLGKIQLKREVIDIGVVLARAFESVQALLESRGQQLDASLHAAPLWSDVDPTRLEQVFVNLLGNASKYSHDGGRIEISAGVEDAHVVIRVRDHGIGMTAQTLTRVFDLFAQADEGLDRTKGGLGIGLSLARKLTELHGGRLGATSDGPGTGSEFIVRLPAAERVHASQSPGIGHVRMRPDASATVLIVDDNADAVEALGLILEDAGYRVVRAFDGQQAIESAREVRPDVVLLDLGLPRMDGFTVAKCLRQEAWGSGALLLAVSGYGQAHDRERSSAAGFDHHLVKPIDYDALFALLQSGRPQARAIL
jgi:PAS domain S-box-containing protein